MKKHIPNMITCLNLISGCIACVVAFNNDYLWAFIFIIIASIFDFFDGFAARLLKAYSNIGKELDSLADVVSFGVAPGMIIFIFLRNILAPGIPAFPLLAYLPYLAFLIPAFSALRLAKFNLDERQTTSFIGFPTPANALFWGSFIYSLSQLYVNPGFLVSYIYITVIIIVCILLFSSLMVSELPMFSLKFKNYSWKGNEARYILMIIAVVLFAIFTFTSISITIIIYILMSLFIRDKH